jgi:TetR/AcrR family transcriptional regulator, cholesterol catabolism regulator
LVALEVSIVLRPIIIMEAQERILLKATDLFVRYGIRSITMDEIALQLGISKKTIYQFFADKNELVDAVIERYIAENRNCCETDRKSAANAVHEIFLAMMFMQEMFENMNPSMLYDLEKYHPRAYEKFSRYKYGFLHRIIKENLKRGIHEELYRADMDIEMMTALRLETMMLPFDQAVFPKNRFSLAAVHQQMVEHFLFGIATIKGYKLISKYKEERIKVKQ